MNRLSIAVLLLLALVVFSPTTALAGLEYEQVVDDYYSVSYELGTMMRGGLLDTQDRVERKLIKKTHKLCADEGYTHLRFLTLQEVAQNAQLRAAWVEATDEIADESAWDKYVERLLETETHSARKVVQFARFSLEGSQRCSKK